PVPGRGLRARLRRGAPAGEGRTAMAPGVRSRFRRPGRKRGQVTVSTTMTLAKAITAGLDKILENDDHAVVIGEDIGKLGGVYRITEGLQGKYGAHRVIDSPLGEAGIVGASVGMALRGHTPLAEIQFDGFVFPAFSQI